MTMTLDELKEAVADICAGCDSERSQFTNADLGDAIDAAIRERDELRKKNADLLSTIELDEQVWVQRDETMHRWIERARNAEAELAALKARMLQGVVLDVDSLARGHAGLPSEWRGKHVRLLVEE